MVRTLTLLVAALVATCVSAAPLDAHQKRAAAATPATDAAAAFAAAFSAIAANPAGGTAVDAAISAAATAASAAAKANQEALIAANGGNTSFLDPEFVAKEAFLQTKSDLELDAGDDAAAAKTQADLNTLEGTLFQ